MTSCSLGSYSVGRGFNSRPRSSQFSGFVPMRPSRRAIATLHDPAVIRKILAHLVRFESGPSPGPAPPASGAAAS